MVWKIFKKSKEEHAFVEPDEIFLDSKNIQNFDRQQFEGRIEKPISKKTISFLGIFFLAVVISFSFRLGYLQIQKGWAYYERSEKNTLEKVILFAERGIIYDRNKNEMAWSKKGFEDEVFGVRSYMSPGLSHVLGYVSYPAKDKRGNYWQGEFTGLDGIEKKYNDVLRGRNGSKIIEVDVYGKIQSENIVNTPSRGNDLTTTIDSRIQKEFFRIIQKAAGRSAFTGGAGVMMNVESGEIIAMTSYPEYNNEILSYGKDRKTINGYLNDKRKVFMDRTISGLYTPGSIVKPIFALAALVENIISPTKKILSTGFISIPNPYFKDQKNVFRDWRAHGWTNMAEALAVSSDVYFYTIGGGYENQKGLGILTLEKYAKLFGVGEITGIDLPDEKSGIIPSPEWKIQNFGSDPWRVGDTYNTSIGQYGFQVTPVEINRAIAAIANKGTLVTPHLILGDTEKEGQTKNLGLDSGYFDVIHQGMRQAVTYGTAVALNVPYIKIAAKTGTAQLGLAKDRINSWVVGFFPYDKPRYAFTLLMESGPNRNNIGASYVMRELIDFILLNAPEYLE